MAGPTASGKSARALAYAVQHNGVVINADASQVYREIPVLSAQPTAADRARAPHALYGTVSGRTPCSAAQWREMARAAIAEAHAAGRVPVLVGGTGLYLATLLEGIADVPPVPSEVRSAVRHLSAPEVRAALEREDPEMARRLHPNDRQRNSRALEVWRATGRSLSGWQEATSGGLMDAVSLRVTLLLPGMPVLEERIARRFEQMLALGALDETRALLRQGLPADAPVMKALGVPQLAAVVRGTATLAEARAAAILATRQYAKRQRTWFRSGGQARRQWLAQAGRLPAGNDEL